MNLRGFLCVRTTWHLWADRYLAVDCNSEVGFGSTAKSTSNEPHLAGSHTSGVMEVPLLRPHPMFILLQETKLSDDMTSDWVLQDSISKEA